MTDLGRDNYTEAESRVIEELKELEKPFLVILNTNRPNDPATRSLANEMETLYNVPVLPMDCAQLTYEDVYGILQEVLYEFPVKEVNILLPKWVEELEEETDGLLFVERETVEKEYPIPSAFGAYANRINIVLGNKR